MVCMLQEPASDKKCRSNVLQYRRMTLVIDTTLTQISYTMLYERTKAYHLPPLTMNTNQPTDKTRQDKHRLPYALVDTSIDWGRRRRNNAPCDTEKNKTNLTKGGMYSTLVGLSDWGEIQPHYVTTCTAKRTTEK